MVEGNKIIRELQDSDYHIQEIYTTDPELLQTSDFEVIGINDRELRKISFLQHPKDSLAVCQIPEMQHDKESDFQLILDGIQDPGNLGTIIRLADWFGIEKIICSEDTADLYNPKVIQASMGSFLRVQVVYTQLEEFMKNSANTNIGTDMEGENIYDFEFPDRINLILGNEGNGMRDATVAALDQKITVPRFGNLKSTESLNVSVAGAIILGQIFGNRKKKPS